MINLSYLLHKLIGQLDFDNSMFLRHRCRRLPWRTYGIKTKALFIHGCIYVCFNLKLRKWRITI